MKLLRLLLFVGFMVSFAKANAQTDEQKKAKQQQAVTNYKAHKKETPVRTQSSAGTPTALDENDPYMGRTQEFLTRLTVTELPKDFPVYQKSYGVVGYNNVVDNYYRTHGSIVKDWVKQKLGIQ
jgi:hypothetical protein